MTLDGCHYLWIREGGDVARAREVRDAGDDAAHDLARASLGHVRHDPDVLRPGDLADQALDRGRDLLFDLLARLHARLERYVDLHRPSSQVVDNRHRGGFGNLLDCQAGGLELLGAQPVPGNIDHVVDASQDAEVAVLRQQGAVAGEVWPVVPVLAALLPVVFGVIRRHESIRVSVDGLEDARPGVADRDVARLAAALRNRLGSFVEDLRKDAQHARAAASGLHRLEGGQGAAQEPAVLRLPPRVHDDRLVLPDLVVVPAPHLGLDRLADRRHVLEAVVVLPWLLWTQLAQHADRRRRGVEDVDVQALGDPPGPAWVRVRGHALVHDARGPQRERAVDNVGMAGDPTDVSEAPVGVLRVDVLVVLRRPRDIREVATRAVLAALGLGGGAAGVHEEERRLSRH